MTKPNPIWLGAALLLQLLIIVAALLLAQLPLLTGTEIRLAAQPVDPRSLLRGNYVILDYPQLRPSTEQLQQAQLRPSQPFYIRLEANADGLYQFAGLSPMPPSNGLYLRGRVPNPISSRRIRYGIEALFLPKQQALATEAKLRDGAIVRVRVDSRGQARLVALEP
ncbi:GDYXXLXY domain-containing protein [uncultured Ferrimonas sp.]|uniref:GDYXXLXY domain-containing protein n=1 Tax=uncultured Ferrimonas sp. TaxID=432640 RepID=UPI00263658DA|nr:GDYXXLXY domain-containing protein [uncultured Ferrimonas sp.]